MLKALDDLEKAVNRLLKEKGKRVSPEPGKDRQPERSAMTASEGPREEAAEHVRRAIKRLRSL